MGAGAAKKVIPSSNALTSFTRALQVGILRGVSSVITIGNPNPTDTWVICFISSGGTSMASAIRILYTDYITTESPLSWSGQYQIVGSEVIVTSSRSTVEITLQTIADVDIG